MLPPPQTSGQASSYRHTNDEGTSRAAFEKLANENADEESGMSLVNKMMEDTESMVATAIVSQLAKSPPPKSRNQPSTLREARSRRPNPKKNDTVPKATAAAKQVTKSASFLGGVLERTRKMGSIKGDKTAVAQQSTQPNNSARATNSLLKQTVSDVVEKQPSLSSHASLQSRPQSTPTKSHPTRSFYSNISTPIGFSPTTFGSSSPSDIPIEASAALMLESFPTASSHGDKIRFDGTPSSTNHSSSPGRPLFGEGATLMENDLEAISALNSLSNSPTRTMANKPTKRAQEEDDAENNGNPGEKKSFFSRVLGYGNEEGGSLWKRRKLDFS